MKFSEPPDSFADAKSVADYINKTEKENPSLKFVSIRTEDETPTSKNTLLFLEQQEPENLGLVQSVAVNGTEAIFAGSANLKTGRIPIELFRAAAAPKPGDVSSALMEKIKTLAGSSTIARYEWKDRGNSPAGYIKGMAVAFATVYIKFKNKDATALAMAKAKTNDGEKDALAWYADIFKEKGMDNSHDGADTLRHLFVLLIGLGMRESSGRYCEGWDRDKLNHGIQNTPENSEAGLFQVSYDSLDNRQYFKDIFNSYRQTPPADGLKSTFQEGVTRTAHDDSVGDGLPRQFQDLSKDCPLFTVEYSAIGLRNLRHEWGPIGTHKAEIRSDCDAMLKQVADLVDSTA